ncbi:nuclear receptor-interacting protein 3-like isoform X1 [Scophthalmus maximus]|uniref:nuclear receptor-interacting protein 3-like isoform X1 n=1 Tax=Scophthalmus maximus TaxID=52904 RepID=UPI001FA8DE5F|nr:nuclear receptor-interacting protein 3-like isoform X1 [Scophthalmus maximus]
MWVKQGGCGQWSEERCPANICPTVTQSTTAGIYRRVKESLIGGEEWTRPHAGGCSAEETHTAAGLTQTPAVMLRPDAGAPDAAALRQQRRLKQAIQFLHKDSADLLPLDGLKKLGTATQGQPHHILQKRLLQAKLSQERMKMCGVANNGGVLLRCSHLNSHCDEEEDKDDLIYVQCKCFGQEVNVLIDTGCKLNLMSSLTVERLGLKGLVEENKVETDGFPFQSKLYVEGHVKELGLTIGQLRIMCSFAILESDRPLMSLGNQTLKLLKCVIDTEKQMLVFGTAVREQVQFAKKPFSESSSDFTDLGY